MVDNSKKILKNIIKECYWDSKMDEKKLIAILNSTDDREIKKIFSKIIYNSKDKLMSLSLFSADQLKKAFTNFKVTYNNKYITRHLLVLKSLLLDEKAKIKGLEWKKL